MFGVVMENDSGNELMLEFIQRLESLPWKDDYEHALETADMLLLDVIRVLNWTHDEKAKLNATLFSVKYDKLRRWSWDKSDTK